MTEKQATTRIASYCSKAERCEYDVKKKLLAWEQNEEVTVRILSFLYSEKFLNEERYILSFIKDKMRFNKWGKNKIIFELKKKHISENTIKKKLDELTDNEFEESLIKILQTKIKTIKATNAYERKVKLFRFAMGRGFQSDMISRCLEKLITEDLSDDYPF